MGSLGVLGLIFSGDPDLELIHPSRGGFRLAASFSGVVARGGFIAIRLVVENIELAPSLG